MANFLANVFGNSPVKPMQKHMAKVFSCVSQLPDFFEAVFNKEWDQVTLIRDKISAMEREADELKKEIRLQLPTGMMLPVSRRDLLEVLTMQDNIANKAKDISGLILGRKMEFPSVVVKHYATFVSRCVDATKQAQRTINELDELVETGFRGKEVKLVQSMIVELDAIEQDTDSIQVKIRFALFEIEKDIPPIDAMFLYKIIEWTGEVADLAQRVGSRLQLMLAK